MLDSIQTLIVNWLSPSDWQALWITVQLACISTGILLFISLPIAWWLAHSTWKYKSALEALIALPLVLPPTVLGFYLLLALAPSGLIGSSLNYLGIASLNFSFAGLVFGSVFYSLPFVVQPLQNTFHKIGLRPLEVAATLGASPIDRFFSIALPQAKQGIITAAVLGFAHTLGEFGVVLMIGGNIPGETQVASIAIYQHVEAIEYGEAHRLSGFLLVLSFVLLVFIYRTNHKHRVASL